MKFKKISILTAVAFMCVLGASAAKTPAAESNQNSREMINKLLDNFGDNVVIDIPENYLIEIVKEPKAPVKKTQSNLRRGINKVDGYRIQVFGNGNNQSTLEARARARGNAVVAKFPKYRGQVYSFSSSPNWYTRIGNFIDQKEASAALAELKRAFPQYANEMRVVKSIITVIK